ncbi:Large ribosomal subunit protein uL18-like protein [Drosera capensis]
MLLSCLATDLKSVLPIMQQGALDGGLDILHSEKGFAGFGKENKQLDSEVHQNYICGGHVAADMRYQSHFSKYIKRGIAADDVEEMSKKVHVAIRADPTAVKSGK